MLKSLKELWRYQELLGHLVVLDLKVRYRKSFFGVIWTVLNPLLLMLVLWAVFGRFARADEESYALFLLSAIMVWICFQQTIDQSLNSVIRNKSLIQKIYVPKLVFPVSVMVSNLLNLGFFFVAYALISIIAYRASATWLLLVPVVVMLALMSTGFSLCLSSLNVFFRDFTHLSGVIMRALFYLTPVIYRPDMLGPRAARLLQLNPVYYPVVAARDVLYYHRVPSVELWTVGFAMAVAICTLGLFVFTRVEHKFVYYA